MKREKKILSKENRSASIDSMLDSSHSSSFVPSNIESSHPSFVPSNTESSFSPPPSSLNTNRPTSSYEPPKKYIPTGAQPLFFATQGNPISSFPPRVASPPRTRPEEFDNPNPEISAPPRPMRPPGFGVPVTGSDELQQRVSFKKNSFFDSICHFLGF